MKIELKIFLTIWIIYIFFLTNYGGDHMSNSMLEGTMAFADTGSFEITNYTKEQCKIVPSGCNNAFYNGKIYPGFPPGNSIIATPVYLLAKPFLNLLPEQIGEYSRLRISVMLLNILATIFIISILSASTAVLVYKFFGHITKNNKNRLFITFIFAFGTLFFLYSTEYYAKTIATFLLFSSFYLLFLIKNKKIKESKKLLFLTALLSSLAVTFEYSSILIVGLLFLYLLSFFRNKRVIYYLIGLIIPIIILLSYHYFIFDNAFSSTYQYHKPTTYYPIVAEKDISLPTLERLWGLLFAPERGFFFFMPFMLLSILGLFKGLKEKRFTKELILISSIFVIIFIFNASLKLTWKGGCEFGPRFLVLIIPFFILPSIFITKKISKTTKILGITSIFINLLPVMYGMNTGCSDPNTLFHNFIPLLLKKGLRNYTLNLINLKLFNINLLFVNIIMVLSLVIIGLIIYYIWKK